MLPPAQAGAPVLEDLLGHPSLPVIGCPVVNSCLFVALLVLFAWRLYIAALLNLVCLSCWGTI